MSTYSLCTMIASINKTCVNDWISAPGTCYEDSCCSSLETSKSWHYRLAQLSHVVFSVIGIILAIIYIKKVRKKIILPNNVKIFVDCFIGLIVLHSIDMILFHIYHLYRSAQVIESDPCSVRVTVQFCAPFRYVYSFCTVALTIGLYCLYVDRLLSLYWKRYTKLENTILLILIVQVVVIPSCLVAWGFRNEDPGEHLLSCINVPSASSKDLTAATAAIFPLNIICFVLSIFLFRVYQKQEQKTRFDMPRHFNAKVDTGCSEFLFKMTATQSFFIVLYPILSLSMRTFFTTMDRPYLLTFATMTYIFSIYSTAVLGIMVLHVVHAEEGRRSTILNQLKMKSIGAEGADNYFNSLKSQWG